MKPVLFLAAFAILFFFTSCKKSGREDMPPPAATVKNLSIKLHTPYLDATKVDSAFATWKINGSEQQVKLIVRHDSLIANLDTFTEGNGTMTIYIYANKKFGNQYFSHWVLKKDLSLQKIVAVSYHGPNSFMDTNWFPRAELRDALGHKAIAGLRPDDSYFLIKNVAGQPGLVRLVVDKSFWKTTGGVHLVGQGTWECSVHCSNANGDVENSNYFDFIPGQIANRAWNHVEFVVFYQTEPHGGGWVVSLNYDI